MKRELFNEHCDELTAEQRYLLLMHPARTRGELEEVVEEFRSQFRLQRVPPGWTAQQKRELAVGLRVGGKIVVYYQGVAPLLHPVLRDGAAGKGCQVLQSGQAAGLGHHHIDAILLGIDGNHIAVLDPLIPGQGIKGFKVIVT